ncbi:GNAT family N-acetyltransferase [Clostridium sardiniense]|uniref:GNAT family N-acetyltransferase n=1 Tax=Clostridium sardiniense TaxID=29369 RepID=A0ABS7KW75_CLOSR|nr:GNAT family N-acetyltransferase [Clostridium sardiniense]MBY0755069.1 GNAT family N-acetyltransferase [Clostridium sardiniense]MDQ0459073.1 N-acetylglutamate synthase-like GNAT family acetyltransferase [Clostridium sardiniense]
MVSLSYLTKDDIEIVVEIYNSNTKFLKEHLDKEEVDKEFIVKELKEMKKMNFDSFKILYNNNVIGICDVRFDSETYLSLLMIDNKLRNNGFGSNVFYEIEKMAKEFNSKSIRIDVVYGYDSNVTEFWIDKGFVIKEKVKFNWDKKSLDAYIMLKYI